MSEWHDVGSVEELERAGWLVARVGGREVGVVRDPEGGRLVGVRNRCPHHGAPLCLGRVRGRDAGTPDLYGLAETRILRCPWHGWEFDLDTGRCRDEPALRVAVYPVRIEGARVLIGAR